MKKFDRSDVKIVVWGAVSMALLLLWGIFDLDFVWIITAITIGILTYLDHRAMRRRKEKK